jgi:hypothetical protein
MFRHLVNPAAMSSESNIYPAHSASKSEDYIPFAPATPQIAYLSVPKFVFKNKPAPVKWRGVDQDVAQITWRNKKTKEYHFLNHHKSKDIFIPPYSGRYDFTLRSPKGEETTYTFQIWVISPILFALGSAVSLGLVAMFIYTIFLRTI